uniref:Uncharacterized protein n=1 Tax=Nelumbo nucifera TaxID=4432 RepID=A0A822XUF0_NELNU|nr:TPA_asm: hypothetical protein HUJ06_022531 [Nelumbo nucifera]
MNGQPWYHIEFSKKDMPSGGS